MIYCNYAERKVKDYLTHFMQIGWRQGRRIEKLLPYSFWVLTRWPGSWRVPPQHGQAFRGSEGRIDLDGNGWWQEDFHVHKVDNAYEIFIVRLFFIPLLLITMSVQLFVRHNILFAGHFLLLRAIYFLCRRNVFLYKMSVMSSEFFSLTMFSLVFYLTLIFWCRQTFS